MGTILFMTLASWIWQVAIALSNDTPTYTTKQAIL
jgi:hypothetical protein